MSGEVVLSSALRSNLLSLQRTQSNIDKVQNVLSTGLKVSSALDNPQNYFASQSLKNRSSDLGNLLDGIGQSIQTIKTADTGVTQLTKLVQQAQSIVDSARDAITNGAKEASITGTVDLSESTNLTSITGVGTTAELYFSANDSAGSAITLSSSTVAISSGDSAAQLITKINDITNSTTGEQAFQAELTSAGYLKVTALNGASFSMGFDHGGSGSPTATATASSSDQTLASALGFGSQALQTTAGVASSSQVYQVAVTALATTKLVSGTFYNNGATSGFADASDLLTTVETTDTGGTARFSASAAESSSIRITVNGTKTSSKITIGTTSIQGLVDAINNDTNIGSLVTASYDNTTGKFSIEADDGSVNTIQVYVDGGADSTATTKADFDFGVQADFTTGAASMDIGETFVLASAASTLSQYEEDYNSVRDQIDDLVSDASYRGVNLLNGDTLETYFNEDRSNKLSTVGSILTSDGLGIAAADFSRLETITAAGDEARGALTTIRNFGSTLSNSLTIIQTREEFTKSLISTLDEGSDKLTVADQNEAGAQLLALQTRQSLGVTALSLASQAQQSVLRLF